MFADEARINEALRRLGEEFRLGMVPAEEYRSRRRMLLESWGERDVTTAPGHFRGGLMKSVVVASPVANAVSRKPLWIGLAVFAAAAVTYSLQRFNLSARWQNMQAATAVTRSSELVALTRAAGDFVEQNRWGEQETATFIRQWRLLSAEDRVRARQEPAIRTLRHVLTQNIQAESQAPDGQADPLQLQRFERLQEFSRSLDAD